MKNIFRNIGPGTLVAAAFIGPGTLTVCTLAGVQFGFTLLWAMGLSIVATLVLQEMAMRLGLVYGKGLAHTIKDQISNKIVKVLALMLILSAIVVGNAAYEAGNISGGVLGVETFVSNATTTMMGLQVNYLSLIVGGIAFILLYIGNYKIIERVLIVLVILMSLSFIITAWLTNPDFSEVLKGLFIPEIPEEGFLMILGLVGTTVVPYNLFLHAAIVKEKWQDKSQLKAAKIDSYISIILGGLVSMAIIVCAAAIQGTSIENAADLAKGIEPLYGSFSKYILSLGLFAAGITSAITAPLAAAYVANECFGWKPSLKSYRFRIVWMTILFLGIIISSIGYKPIEVIKFAQIANGILLPVIVGFLLWVVNRKGVLGSNTNSIFQNVIGVVIFITTIILGLRSLEKVFQFSIF
ncbi:MAG: Nramp family divalent metal transporter [Flavobacteriaceae bacterium]